MRKRRCSAASAFCIWTMLLAAMLIYDEVANSIPGVFKSVAPSWRDVCVFICAVVRLPTLIVWLPWVTPKIPKQARQVKWKRFTVHTCTCTPLNRNPSTLQLRTTATETQLEWSKWWTGNQCILHPAFILWQLGETPDPPPLPLPLHTHLSLGWGRY